jgi:thiol-disulfide isomerase/thioredoxin
MTQSLANGEVNHYRIPVSLRRVSDTDVPAKAHKANPVNFRLVGLVVAVGLVVIVGYGLITGSESLDASVTDPVITGVALPDFENDPLGDGAVGALMPSAIGTDFTGSQVEIAPTGKPQILLFLAHWCSHCRDEVPTVQTWIDTGNLPAEVEFRSIATAIDSGAANYPPDAWLDAENWTPEVLADTRSDVARSFGLAGFPYWVFVDGDGTVVGRWGGPLPLEQLDIIVAALQG